MDIDAAHASREADTEVPIRYLSIGLWNKRSRGNTTLSALILHSTQQLVFLVDNTASPRVVRRGYKRYLRHLTAGSPFRSSLTDSECVLTFEVDCKYIGGIDYSNPLCLPGRLVLESREVVRKEFATREDALEFYKFLAIRSQHTECLPAKVPSLTDLADKASLGNSKYGVNNSCLVDKPETSRISHPPDWHSPSPSPGPKFRLGQSAEKRGMSKTPTRRRSEIGQSPGPWRSETGTPRTASPVASRPRRRTTADSGSKERPERQSRLSLVSTEHAAEDHSKRKRGELQDDIQETSTFGGSRFELSAYSGGTVANLEEAFSRTRPSAHYNYCTITFNFDEPDVPTALKPLIEGDERLLKLYESGLPAWAIYAPQYGIWYRPWMRTITYMLFVLLSCFSLVMGFYDLYKNVPYLDQFLRQYGSFPAAAIMQWLDEHLSFRLSILFAYLFGKSEFAVQLLRYMGTLGAMCKEALQPLVTFFGPAFNGWLASVKECALSLRLISQPLTSVLSAAASTLISQPLIALGTILYSVFLPVCQAMAYAGTTLIFGPLTFIQLLSSGLASFVLSAKDIGNSIASVFSAGSRIAPSVQSAQGVGSQVSWLYSAIRLEALEVVKTSFVKVVKALQTLARLCVHCGSRLARHRQTLELRLRRQGRKAKQKAGMWMPTWLLGICGYFISEGPLDDQTVALPKNRNERPRPKSAEMIPRHQRMPEGLVQRRSMQHNLSDAMQNSKRS